ncbi:serine hydrolase [Chitinophaga jiangningensis]|nr:serine hydrolase [Chitinophaga jiangningensis]
MAQTSSPAVGSCNTRLAGQLEQLMAAYAANGLFNGSVMITRQGTLLLKKGYGFSNLAKKEPNTASTKYALYSITKPMTATLILLLAEQGQLRLNDRLSRFYPGFPAGDSITIYHLLTHTSGLYAYNNDNSMPTQSEDAMIEFLSQHSLEFVPGSQWRYCNTGYYLLGFIIERLTGLSYAEALQTYLFTPLQMQQSSLDFRSLSATRKAQGYHFMFLDSAQQASTYPYEELRSAGGVWSTAGDLYKFHEAMQRFRIITDTSTSKAYTPYKNKYGLGWFIDSIMGCQVVSHSGGAAGFRTLLVRVPEKDICIILLANAENMDLEPIKEQLLRVLFAQPYEIPHNIHLPIRQLNAIAGTYQLDAAHTLYITRIHQQLTGQVSGQQPVLLLAGNDGKFTVPGMKGYLEFIANGQGKYDSVRFFRKGRVYAGTKITPKWGISGTATPNDWNGPDIMLLPDPNEPKRWRVLAVNLKNGLIKFRFNNDWTRNLGKNKNNAALIENGQDISVSAGTYNIILDLTNPGNPCWKMTPVIP